MSKLMAVGNAPASPVAFSCVPLRTVGLLLEGELVQRHLPESNFELLPGIEWGEPWDVFSPAYWLTQAWMARISPHSESAYGADNLLGEVVFCLLGGFGITAELALAAFDRCKSVGLIEAQSTDPDAWSAVLKQPLSIGTRTVHYRFPNQKAKFLAAAMARYQEAPLDTRSGRVLRDELLHYPGIGYKTASWIARNVLGSDEVAILDIHLIRAGRLCGLFSACDRVERDYLDMERRFLAFADALGLRASALDCLMWDHMRDAGNLPIMLLDEEARRCEQQRTLIN